jgi:D-amino-acid oxidase
MAKQHSAGVAIVGAGIAGLTTAVRLLDRGVAVALHAERRAPRLASAVAPAMFTPFAGSDAARSRGWAEVSLETFREFERREGVRAGVRFGPFREYCYGTPGPRPFADLSDERPAPDAPSGFAAVLDSVRPHVDTRVHLAWLEARVRALGGRFVDERVDSLPSLFDRGYGVVINCAGVGARELAHDPEVRAMRGLVMHARSVPGLVRSVHDDAPGGVVTYVFVYDDHVVLGSTYERDVWDETFDDTAADAILERCRALVRLDGCLRWRELGAEVIDRRVGLRPARGTGGRTEDIRIDVEHVAPGRAIVHHYGHGRSGISLAWGTSAEVAARVLELMT